jgi:hypothetical protein
MRLTCSIYRIILDPEHTANRHRIMTPPIDPVVDSLLAAPRSRRSPIDSVRILRERWWSLDTEGPLDLLFISQNAMADGEVEVFWIKHSTGEKKQGNEVEIGTLGNLGGGG